MLRSVPDWECGAFEKADMFGPWFCCLFLVQNEFGMLSAQHEGTSAGLGAPLGLLGNHLSFGNKEELKH